MSLALPKLGVAGLEIAAYARHAWLMRHDVAPVLPERAEPGHDVVVCLHGLFATAGVLRPLRSQLERHDAVHTATMTYPAGPGIESLARRLAELVSMLPSGVRIHLLGHSVGGVVSRYFAEELGDPRVVQTISMATPFAGVRHAHRLGANVTKDIAPSSRLLRQLRLGSTRRLTLPHLSLIAEDDAVIKAPISHALPGGDVTLIRRCGHNAMLFHEEVARLVEARVLAFGQGGVVTRRKIGAPA